MLFGSGILTQDISLLGTENQCAFANFFFQSHADFGQGGNLDAKFTHTQEFIQPMDITILKERIASELRIG
jgi:hypothetical protein